MSASLVGSEMCIRDSPEGRPTAASRALPSAAARAVLGLPGGSGPLGGTCLLYTSDAADDM
eukprot:9362088-Alexandrium_andersonii.AAC.1